MFETQLVSALEGVLRMTASEVMIAKIALEMKYDVERETQQKLQQLYLHETGRTSDNKACIIRWFCSNYEFDGIDTWCPRDQPVVH
jgi:hypothetical protein